MTRYTVFPNAPITQAIIDIKLELPSTTRLETLGLIINSIEKEYPHRQDIHSAQIQFPFPEPGKQGLVQSRFAQDGYMFQTQDRKRILETKLDGFTLSQLKPYKDWASFRDEAKKLWELYYNISKPIKITRLATRYINRIELPGPKVDFNEYFRTTPEIASKLPQELSEFFMRLVMPQPDNEVTAIVTQTIDARIEDESILPYIFDIDVFQLGNWEPDSEQIWEIMEKLRNVKNDIFFRSIKPKAKELFK